MGYGWQVKLNGFDISDKVSGFTITCSLDNYCREMSLDIADPDLYAELDFSQISESPEIEILTKVADTFISQGTFFVERPALASTVDSDLMSGVWGRSLTALLGEPFAPKVTKSWETQTTFFGICEEMCGLAGLTWDSAYSDIDDFIIFPHTYAAEGSYPVDIITELAGFAGALVTTDRLGHLCIKQINYAPVAADVTITDADIDQISESPEWPAFGNRISITPTGATSGYSVALTIADECLSAEGVSRTKLYAQVKDADDAPVSGIVVDWSIDSVNASLDYADTNTGEVLIRFEPQKASNFYTVEVDFEPDTILGVWAASDTAKSNNLAAAGYEVDGRTITLTGKLAYCNQSLVVSYYSDGIAVNYLTAGLEPDDVTVTADVEGQEDTGIVYIDNPCQCPPSIDLTAAPTSIAIGGTSSLLVYVEESGPVTSGRYVFMAHTSATRRGTLSWTKARLGTVSIKNEKTTAINEISGITQCETSMYPKSVSAVYRADENGAAYGSNLYSSHDGKVINLSTDLESGSDLLVNYVAQGAALNKFTGTALGTAGIKAYISSTREEGVEAETTVRIEDNTETTDDYPDNDWKKDPDDGDLAGPGGDEEDYDPSKKDPFPPGGPPGGFYNWCVPDNVSSDPNPDALGGRFAKGLEHDCSCEEMCDTEFYIHNTTQNYDGASGRSISKIVVDDYGYDEGSAAYWEKYAEIKQAALNACLEQCETCENLTALSVDTESTSETIVAGGSASIVVLDGLAPFTWSVSGKGYSLTGSPKTETRSNGISCVSGTCGTDFDAVASITCTDACGNSVSAEIRNTSGSWILKSSCGIASGQYGELISGKTKKTEYTCTVCTNLTCNDCPPPYTCTCECRCSEAVCGSPTIAHGVNPACPNNTADCALNGYLYYEWSCE